MGFLFLLMVSARAAGHRHRAWVRLPDVLTGPIPLLPSPAAAAVAKPPRSGTTGIRVPGPRTNRLPCLNQGKRLIRDSPASR